jgi:hypothetical protein
LQQNAYATPVLNADLHQVNGYEVFDSYVEDVERQRIAKEKAAAATAKKPAAKDEKDEHEEGETKEVAKEAVHEPAICFENRLCFVTIVVTDFCNVGIGACQDVVHSAAMSKSLKIIERMVNQNTYDEIAQDFR